jgi:hypothetical protein
VHAAIQALVAIHHRHRLPGCFEPTDQAWPAALPASAALQAFYSSHDPRQVKIDTGMSPIRLFELAGLERGQQGYRWQGDPALRNAAPNWNPAMVVFADNMGGGAPVMADTGSAGTPVWASAGPGGLIQIAASLADFMRALAAQIDIVYGDFAIFDVLDDNDEVKTDFAQQLRARLEPILGKTFFDAYWDYFYG